MSALKTSPEFRTLEQIAADEDIASASESGRSLPGWGMVELLTPEAADDLMAACEQESQLIERFGSNQAAALGLNHHPFRWGTKTYRITRLAYANGKADVEILPPDEVLKAEVARRVESDRFHTLGYSKGFGFICFPEDYAKYTNG